MVESDAADVVVLVGAAMAAMPARVQAAIAVPVIEGFSCAVTLAEALVRLRLPKPRAGSYAALPTRELLGVSPAITALFG